MNGPSIIAGATLRPRWRVLYLSLFVIAVAGTIAHAMVANVRVLVTIADVASALGLLGAMAVWVRLNRVQLSDEPDEARLSPLRAAHAGRANGARADHDGVVRLAPGERVVIPDDFR